MTTRRDIVITEVFGGEAAITPSDLLSKEFKRIAVGGYNTNQVDEYLEQVAEVFERMITQVRKLKEEAEQLRDRLEEYRQMEASLRNALVSSQKFSEDTVEAAKREAQVILEEARIKKAQAQLEASKVPIALSQDILLLQQQRNRLRAEMTSILETHRNLLDSLIPEETVKRPTSVFEVAGSADSEAEAAPAPPQSDEEGPPKAPEPPTDLDGESVSDDAPAEEFGNEADTVFDAETTDTDEATIQ